MCTSTSAHMGHCSKLSKGWKSVVVVHLAGVFLDSHFSRRSVGLMDKASASGAGDSRFESWADQVGAQEKWQTVE